MMTLPLRVPSRRALSNQGLWGALSEPKVRITMARRLGVTEDDSETTNGVTFTFTPLGGIMKSSCFEALITTGDYAGYTLNYPTYVEMLHK
jgi:hypothetical protein